MLPEKDRPVDLEPIKPVQKHKSVRLANIFMVLSLLVLAFSVGIFLKWSFQDELVLKVNNEPFPTKVVPDPTNATGGILIVTIDYCKLQSTEGTVRVSYLSKSTEYFTPTNKERLEKGCNKIDSPIVIPKDLPHDKYRLKFRVVYDINPLKQDVAKEFVSQEFEAGAQEQMVQ